MNRCETTSVNVKVFLLWWDPSELDAGTDDPAWLKGAFSSRRNAEEARHELEDSSDVRWVIVERVLNRRSWTEGFSTVSSIEDDCDSP